MITVSHGWCGGIGEAVLDPATRSLRRVDDLPVFLDAASESLLMAGVDLSGTWEGTPVVRFAGRVRLERRRGSNPSVPPPGLDADHYALVIEELRETLVVGTRVE